MNRSFAAWLIVLLASVGFYNGLPLDTVHSSNAPTAFDKVTLPSAALASKTAPRPVSWVALNGVTAHAWRSIFLPGAPIPLIQHEEAIDPTLRDTNGNRAPPVFLNS